MNVDQVEERLLYELRGARTEDLFTGASAIDLVLHIREAAKTMVGEGRTSEDDFGLATQSLNTVLAEMDATRAELNLSEYHEITVGRAFAKLCPGFWPFC
jgi:hypothetical protein